MSSRNKNIAVIIGSILLGLFLGWVFFTGESEPEEEHVHSAAEETLWTCSMHPQIRQPEPGDCPICGMDLIPLESEISSGNPQALQMSENALRLANVQTMEVGLATAESRIRLNGKIAIDERRTSVQTSHIPGRIENLLVNFTGESVNRGQALARIYSPELVTAQEELLQAYAIRESQPELYEATRAKFRNWRISEAQIDQILERGEANTQFTITADVSGIVTEKLVELGDYVERGAPIFEIANLSEVWVQFDLYETMSWISEGSTVEFTVASIPGETFEGTVEFVDPTLDDQSRVATARISVENPEGRLKPGMFVSGVVEASPVETSSQIIVPRSAVLWTGQRSVVYVKEEAGESPSFMLREVVLGPVVGDSYVIAEGLEPGEEVVVNGAFTIDAAAQLAGKPSMMSPDMGLDEDTGNSEREDIRAFLENNTQDFAEETSQDFREELADMLQVYLNLKEALVDSNAQESSKLAEVLEISTASIEAEGLAPGAAAFWAQTSQRISMAAESISGTEELEEQRQAFVALSEELIRLVKVFGVGAGELYVDYCPMANSDRGAFWLSESEEIRNPYYGEAMLTCGEIVTQIN